MTNNKNVIATTRQFERIKIIHEHIRSNEYPTVDRLTEIINSLATTAEEKTTSITTNRDIKKMRDLYNAPIVHDHLKNGYYYSTDFNLPLLNTVSSEQMTILSSAKTLLSHYEGTPLYNETLALIDKLTSGTFKKNDSLMNRIALTPTPKIKVDNILWNKITTALEQNLVLKFDYNGRWNTKTSYRIVHPYQLLLDNGVCFLWGYDESVKDDKEKMRLFNLTRMRAVGVTQRHFELPSDFEFEKQCGGGKFGAYHDHSKINNEYIIEFYGNARAYARSCIWADNQTITEDDENEKTILTFSANQFAHILGWILEQGHNAKPVAPQKLVDEWKKEIQMMSEMLK